VPRSGIDFANKLQDTYRKDKKPNCMYLDGIIEAMTQVEALRLASLQVDPAKLTSQDVLEKASGDQGPRHWRVYVSKFTYAKDKVQGVDAVSIQQVQDGRSWRSARSAPHIVPPRSRSSKTTHEDTQSDGRGLREEPLLICKRAWSSGKPATGSRGA